MERYSLPIDQNIIDNIHVGCSIDMSDLNFPVDQNSQKKAAIVFLRNSGIEASLDFSNCSYEDKAEYLMMFMKNNINISSNMLASTWIEILSTKDGGDVYLPTILNADEIKQFCDEYRDYIDELYQFINSLPIHAMMVSGLDNSVFNTEEFEKTDFADISLVNFSKLIDFDEFILLVDSSTPQKNYTKLFLPKDGYYINQISNKLPYLNMLRVIYQGSEAQDAVINSINSILVPPESDSDTMCITDEVCMEAESC